MKELIEKTVKHFFSSMEESMRKKMNYFMSDKSEMSEKLDKCESIVRELENMGKQLEDPSHFLETVEKTLRLEGGRLVSKMAEDYEHI